MLYLRDRTGRTLFSTLFPLALLKWNLSQRTCSLKTSKCHCSFLSGRNQSQGAGIIHSMGLSFGG